MHFGLRPRCLSKKKCKSICTETKEFTEIFLISTPCSVLFSGRVGFVFRCERTSQFRFSMRRYVADILLSECLFM